MPRRQRQGRQAAGAVRAALYLRVSTEDQAREGYGLEAQAAATRAYVAAQGWETAEPPYIDAGVSGAKAERPALDQLLRDAEAGQFSRVVVLKLDRLGRSLRNLLALYDALERRGVAVVSVKEAVDTGSSVGRLFRNILASLAEFERETIAERVRGGRLAKARQGGSLGGFVPFGYSRRADGTLEVAPEAAATVRRIFELRSAGMTLQAIADTLRAEQRKTARGGAWRPSAVQVILDNQTLYATGRRVYDKRNTPVEAEQATAEAILPPSPFRQSDSPAA